MRNEIGLFLVITLAVTCGILLADFCKASIIPAVLSYSPAAVSVSAVGRTAPEKPAAQ